MMPDSSRRLSCCSDRLGNVARDFFGAQLGVARHHHELFDVDRGVAVFSHHTLADQDRVLEVVAVPGHEGDQHVLADGDFAKVRRCTVGNHIPLGDLVALLDDGRWWILVFWLER
jgi:hypothetical protein